MVAPGRNEVTIAHSAMPTTHHSEAALARRKEKLEFARAFPGMLTDWARAAGRTVKRVCQAPAAAVLFFTDGSFLIARPDTLSNDELLNTLDAVREELQQAQPAGFAELQRKIDAEREAMRKARMEKVLGAVETNLPAIPELRAELRLLLERLD